MLQPLIGHGGLFTHQTRRRRPLLAAAPEGLLALPHRPLAGGFDYLFPGLLAHPQNTLSPGPATITALRALGAAMGETASNLPDTNIPTGYTYLGQFIDHDITKQEVTRKRYEGMFDITRDNFAPLTVTEIRTHLANERTAPFDLDSLYRWPARRRGELMVLGFNTPSGPLPPGKDPSNNDVPRAPLTTRRFQPRQALIGDPRNDENLIISQLQVAFLKFHNQLVTKQHLTFAQAAKAVRQHYQAVAIFDFLRRIAEPTVVAEVLAGNRLFRPDVERGLFMPLEFSAAAFRFGHSMVRPIYRYNVNFPTATFRQLFSFTALSGQIGPPDRPDISFDTVPGSWIIQWENFLELTDALPEHTRPIDTALALPLAELPKQQNIMARLAQRNLLRGYLLNLPTGQSIARCLGGSAAALTPADILAAANPADRQVLVEHPELVERTPLWYYILVEAKVQQGGQRLGRVGSTLVAETIIGLIRQSADSILCDANWRPSLGDGFPAEQDKLELRHIIEFAGLKP